MEPVFELANNVIRDIQALVVKDGVSYMDAIVHYANTSGIEIEVLGDIIKKNDMIKSKIELEAEELHFLKRKNRLPV